MNLIHTTMTEEMIKELELDIEAINAVNEQIASDLYDEEYRQAMLEAEEEAKYDNNLYDVWEAGDAFCDNPGNDQCDCGKSTVSKCVDPNCKDYHSSHMQEPSSLEEMLAEADNGLPF